MVGSDTGDNTTIKTIKTINNGFKKPFFPV